MHSEVDRLCDVASSRKIIDMSGKTSEWGAFLKRITQWICCSVWDGHGCLAENALNNASNAALLLRSIQIINHTCQISISHYLVNGASRLLSRFCAFARLNLQEKLQKKKRFAEKKKEVLFIVTHILTKKAPRLALPVKESPFRAVCLSTTFHINRVHITFNWQFVQLRSVCAPCVSHIKSCNLTQKKNKCARTTRLREKVHVHMFCSFWLFASTHLHSSRRPLAGQHCYTTESHRWAVIITLVALREG